MMIQLCPWPTLMDMMVGIMMDFMEFIEGMV